MFCSDKPIQSNKNDLLNRTSFSQQLAQAILSYTSKDNFTISLCGKWGCGKTSILNMVEEYIGLLTKEYDADDKPIIVHFNPWNYSDRSQLTVQFFKTILSELNVSFKSDALKKASEALQCYSSFIEYAELIPVAGKYLKPLTAVSKDFADNLSNLYDNKTTLEEQKKEVINALSSQNQKLIIIIDDIDRLNNEQIKLIFQLVNSLASFPNMIYLLSFDREVVSRALSSEQNCNGEEYLEKIIQVPFDVPEVKKSHIHKLLFNKLEDLLFNEIPCDNFDKEYWDTVFNYCISPFIKGIRDVNRIINVFRFKYGLMHNETNCIDLLATTTLQICAPSIYYWIYSNENKICGSYYGTSTTGIEQNKAKEEYLEEFKNIYEENPQVMLTVIQTLFPKFSWNTGGYTHQSDTAEEMRRKQKIACISRFPFYFNLSLEDVSISKSLILKSINEDDYDSLKNLFSTLTKENKIQDYLDELISYVSTIPEDRLRIFIDTLIDMQTIDENYESKSTFAPITAYKCSECCWTILKRLDHENAYNELLSLVESSNFETFSIILDMVLSIERSYGKIGNSIDYFHRIIDEEELQNIEKAVLKKLINLSKEYNLWNTRGLINLYFIWNYLDEKSMNEYFKATLTEAENIPKYLSIKASYWHGGTDSGWCFKNEDFFDWLTLDSVYEKIVSLKGTEDFAKLKFAIKEMAVAYVLWYETDREKNKGVSKKTVDELIQKW